MTKVVYAGTAGYYDVAADGSITKIDKDDPRAVAAKARATVTSAPAHVAAAPVQQSAAPDINDEVAEIKVGLVEVIAGIQTIKASLTQPDANLAEMHRWAHQAQDWLEDLNARSAEQAAVLAAIETEIGPLGHIHVALHDLKTDIQNMAAAFVPPVPPAAAPAPAAPAVVAAPAVAPAPAAAVAAPPPIIPSPAPAAPSWTDWIMTRLAAHPVRAGLAFAAIIVVVLLGISRLGSSKPEVSNQTASLVTITQDENARQEDVRQNQVIEKLEKRLVTLEMAKPVEPPPALAPAATITPAPTLAPVPQQEVQLDSRCTLPGTVWAAHVNGCVARVIAKK